MRESELQPRGNDHVMSWTTALAVTAFALSLLLTRAAITLAGTWGFLDLPDTGRKRHARATPLLGGVAVCLSILITVLMSACFLPELFFDGTTQSRFSGLLLLGMLLLCGIGAWDDRHGMSARRKLLLQSVAVLPFACFAVRVDEVQFLAFQWNLDWLAIPFVLLWLVSCTNFVNLVDGLDGLAGSLVLIVSVTVAALSAINGWPATSAWAMITAAAVCGFLVFNRPPAAIFLGDSGSLPLGFLVGALSMAGSSKRAAGLTLVMPVVLMAVPLFDTVMAIIRRKLNGRHIGQGDREHIHHCLRDLGLTPLQTLLALAGMSLLTGVAVVASAIFHTDSIAVFTCGGLFVALIAGRVFGFRELLLFLRHVEALLLWGRNIPRSLRLRFLVARAHSAESAETLGLWPVLVTRIRRLRGVRLEFECYRNEQIPRLATATSPASLNAAIGPAPSNDRNAALSSRKRLLSRLSWTATDEQPGSTVQTPAWQISLATPRGDGTVVLLRAEGPSLEELATPPIIDTTNSAFPANGAALRFSARRFNEFVQLLSEFAAACPLDEALLRRATAKIREADAAALDQSITGPHFATSEHRSPGTISLTQQRDAVKADESAANSSTAINTPANNSNETRRRRDAA